MSKQHRVELARTLCASGKPVNKSQLAKVLGIARSSLHVHPQRPPTAGAIWPSDQGKQYGAEQTRHLLFQNGFIQSMSRAGTPTDNGSAERFVGSFKLAVAELRPYRTLGAFLKAAEAWVNFYNISRPHEGLGNQSPVQYAQEHQLYAVPSVPLL
jgi:putative transposase